MSERLRNIAIAATTAFVAYELSNSAFSFKSRKQIVERDGGVCTVCGATDHLEASHKNHTRNRNYDKPENGELLCDIHHLADHIKRNGQNGLPPKANAWAINQIEKRVREHHGWDGITQAYNDAWEE